MSRNSFILWLVSFCLLMPVHRSWTESRTWEGRNGSRTEAELVKQIGSTILLKKSDGTIIRVPVQKLSDRDQQVLRNLQEKKSATPLKQVQDNPTSLLITKALEEIVANEKIPGMTAAIISAEGVLAIGVTGVRKEGTTIPVENTDQLHLGSCTKAMTAVLIATLVAEDRLSWDTTLLDVFPSMKKKIHPDYHSATVWQLLSHRSRFPASAKDFWAHQGLTIQKRRLAIMEESLEQAPEVAEGDYLYSNLGYMVAGCIAEERTGDSWETLMQERIFEPLGMDSAGFGPPGKMGRVNQPWGHNRKAGSWQPFQTDNSAALGPAGTVHCSIEDWGKFVALQLSETNPLQLDQALLTKLITPSDGTYAGGWGISKRSWAKGIVLSHSGSNTMWLSLVWAAPNIDRAFLVVTNSKDDRSVKICDQVIAKLIEINAER